MIGGKPVQAGIL